MNHDHVSTLCKGIIGVSSTVASFVVTKLDQLEQWFRISASAVGIVVGILTIISLLRGRRNHPHP